MYQAIAASQVRENYVTNVHTNVFIRFYQWTVKQQEKRFMWLAFTFILQTGLALPVTLLSVVTLGSNNINLWLIVCITNVPSLALTLAAQPTKVILPILFFAWLVDAGIMIYTLMGFLLHR